MYNLYLIILQALNWIKKREIGRMGNVSQCVTTISHPRQVVILVHNN